MPIINLCKPTDEGATGHHYGAGDLYSGQDESGKYLYEGQGPRAYWTRLSHVGLCIRDYERNGYDDSDFHMIVWDPEKGEPRDICFASTRGWSYPCYGSSPDATPEVLAAYEAWQQKQAAARKAQERSAKARRLAEERRAMIDAADAFDFSYPRLLKLRKQIDGQRFSAAMWLLTAKIRSGFKLSMRQQLIAWLRDPAPKYQTPLSRKQFDYLPQQSAR